LEYVPPQERVYVDETGLDSNDLYAYGWSQKGERCHALKQGGSKERISVIAGLNQSKLMAPCYFTGYTDANFFNAWLEQELRPTLTAGMTVIMDNARFHKSDRTREIIENAGCKLLFLPPYSPDLNPIEHRWFPLKNTARKILQTFEDITAAIQTAILMS
jgi:transposase